MVIPNCCQYQIKINCITLDNQSFFWETRLGEDRILAWGRSLSTSLLRTDLGTLVVLFNSKTPILLHTFKHFNDLFFQWFEFIYFLISVLCCFVCSFGCRCCCSSVRPCPSVQARPSLCTCPSLCPSSRLWPSSNLCWCSPSIWLPIRCCWWLQGCQLRCQREPQRVSLFCNHLKLRNGNQKKHW